MLDSQSNKPTSKASLCAGCGIKGYLVPSELTVSHIEIAVACATIIEDCSTSLHYTRTAWSGRVLPGGTFEAGAQIAKLIIGHTHKAAAGTDLEMQESGIEGSACLLLAVCTTLTWIAVLEAMETPLKEALAEVHTLPAQRSAM